MCHSTRARPGHPYVLAAARKSGSQVKFKEVSTTQVKFKEVSTTQSNSKRFPQHSQIQRGFHNKKSKKFKEGPQLRSKKSQVDSRAKKFKRVSTTRAKKFKRVSITKVKKFKRVPSKNFKNLSNPVGGLSGMTSCR